jgi:hypothetical protein
METQQVRGGRSKSPSKVAASRENGKLGGRPKKGTKSKAFLRAEKRVRKLFPELGDGPIMMDTIKENFGINLDNLEDAFHNLKEASNARRLADANDKERIAEVVAAKEIVEFGYKFLAKKHHPDLVLDNGKMTTLNAAVIWLRSQL